MRKPVIAGNFKMFKTPSEASKYAEELKRATDGIEGVGIVIAPTFPALVPLASVIGGSKIALAAQDVFWEKEGAYTGEVSAWMLAEAGCTHVIVGHSERRQYFGETDSTVNRKAKACLEAGLQPIICIGEKLEERRGGETFRVLERQLESALDGIRGGDSLPVLVAYEPVWAIGTGWTATPDQAEESHAFIRSKLEGFYDKKISENLSILYGGSVKPDNVREILKEPNVDGALVGGASLKVDSFAKIITVAQEVISTEKP